MALRHRAEALCPRLQPALAGFRLLARPFEGQICNPLVEQLRAWDMTLLDVGCGDGRITQSLAESRASVPEELKRLLGGANGEAPQAAVPEAITYA